ncbi:hypothetical protein FOZ62_012264, partial [Perkinsus olseni]
AAKALLVRTFDGTPHPDMTLKRFNAYQWDRTMEKVTDVLETVVKKVKQAVTPGLRPPQPRPPFGGKGQPRQDPGRGSCGICRQRDHGNLSCPFKKSDKGCAICGTEGHLARACPRNPFVQLASITADDREADADQSRN